MPKSSYNAWHLLMVSIANMNKHQLQVMIQMYFPIYLSICLSPRGQWIKDLKTKGVVYESLVVSLVQHSISDFAKASIQCSLTHHSHTNKQNQEIRKSSGTQVTLKCVLTGRCQSYDSRIRAHSFPGLALRRMSLTYQAPGHNAHSDCSIVIYSGWEIYFVLIQIHIK